MDDREAAELRALARKQMEENNTQSVQEANQRLHEQVWTGEQVLLVPHVLTQLFNLLCVCACVCVCVARV